MTPDYRRVLDISSQRLDWLIARDVIPRQLEQRWDAIRSLRDHGSHATFQGIQMPGHALETLHILRAEIDAPVRASRSN